MPTAETAENSCKEDDASPLGTFVVVVVEPAAGELLPSPPSFTPCGGCGVCGGVAAGTDEPPPEETDM